MNTPHPLKLFLTDCARLLYWTYFKPYTFNQWLQKIHPSLDFKTNPFQFRQEFANNLPLQRYADQVLWITLITPWLVALIVAIPYTLISGTPFQWFVSVLFLAGYSLGVWLATVFPAKLQGYLLGLALLFWLGMLLVSGPTGDLPKLLLMLPNGQHWIDLIPVFSQNIKVIFFLMGIVAGGVAYGVVFGVALGVALGVAWR
jgi:hypothetical protein